LSSNDRQLRDHLLDLLRGGDAHVHFDDLIKDFPTELINTKLDGVPYTAWHVLEHMRIAQWDILEFSRNAAHVSPAWPEGYWPAPSDTSATVEDWIRSIESFRADLREMEALVNDSSVDLFAPIPHGTGQTLLREALLVVDHNAYHLGVLTLMKRIGGRT
jgi:DinB superfamily